MEKFAEHITMPSKPEATTKSPPTIETRTVVDHVSSSHHLPTISEITSIKETIQGQQEKIIMQQK